MSKRSREVRARHIVSPIEKSFAVDESLPAFKRAMQIDAQQRHRSYVRLKIQRARRRMR